jgi:hypothetical protein
VEKGDGVEIARCVFRVVFALCASEKLRMMNYSLKFFVSLLEGIKGIESMFFDRKSI